MINQASIVFDANPAIDTPQTLHTVDRDAPTSRMSPLPPLSNQGWVALAWAGSDLGSGIGRYRIYVSVDGAAFTPWAERSETTATFAGQSGHSYAFCSLAIDNVGKHESKQLVAEAAVAFERLVGDINFDGVIDGLEFSELARCMVGPDVTTAPPGVLESHFARADLDGDDDGDLQDFAAFQRLFTGS